MGTSSGRIGRTGANASTPPSRPARPDLAWCVALIGVGDEVEDVLVDGVQQPADGRCGAGDPEAQPARGSPVVHRDQRPEPGAVEEGDGVEVSDQVRAGLRECPHQLRFHHRAGGTVDITGQPHDAVHRPPPLHLGQNTTRCTTTAGDRGTDRLLRRPLGPDPTGRRGRADGTSSALTCPAPDCRAPRSFPIRPEAAAMRAGPCDRADPVAHSSSVSVADWNRP